ncbi:MAG: hypothetical protein P8181_04605 [bacterium]
MSEKVQFWTAVSKICSKNHRFKPAAYGFVMESLEFTIHRLEERRHVSAQELLDGLCDYAVGRFGILAHTVITSWGIQTAADVGTIVYELIDAGALQKQPEDSFDDFKKDLDLKRVLEDDYFE